MKTINKNWLWVIGGLMLLNIALLSFIWIKKPNYNPPSFLEGKLNFSESQKQEFENLKADHKSKMKGLTAEVDLLKDKLYSNFSTSGLTNAEIKELTIQLGQQKAESDFLTYQHLKEVRGICTPEQQQEFDKLISEIVRGIDRRMPPPPPGDNRPMRGEEPPEGRRPPPR